MANDRAKKPAQDAADAFNNESAKGAPESPRLNRQQVIAQIKGIFKKNRKGNSFITYDNEELDPTQNQNLLMQAIEKSPIVFVEGPVGTGKTSWTSYMALQGLVEKKYNHIAITAPVVEAGEKLGFLKGDLNDKMFPYINQILEAFDEWIGMDLRLKLQETGIIEIAPHAFMRGRSLKNTFFILDESQNANGPQLMTSITRIGYDSTFVYMGDNFQNDRTTGDAALVQFVNRFTDPAYVECGFVSHVRLGASDVRRHPFLKMMVERGDERPLDKFENHSSGNGVTVTPRDQLPQSAPYAHRTSVPVPALLKN